jgi:uncharacterized membrane protein
MKYQVAGMRQGAPDRIEVNRAGSPRGLEELGRYMRPGPIVYAFLALSALLTIFGDYYSKRWADGGGTRPYLLSWLVYSMGTGVWFMIIRHGKELGRMVSVWAINNVLIGLLLGCLVFGESLGPWKLLGAILGVVGIVLMSI